MTAKKLISAILALTAIAMTGCRNTDKLNIVPLRSAGKQIQSPAYNADECKPEGSLETLQSLRYVEGVPVYYLDYTAKVDWEQLSFPVGGLDIHSYAKVCDKRDSLLYNDPAPNPEPGNGSGACSAFVCHNPEGELLFCRNYDYHLDPMVVVFNKNAGPGEHRSVLMTDWQVDPSFNHENSPYSDHYCLLEPGINVNFLLRQPFFTVDGMNDVGLCMAAFQLPAFEDPLNPVQEMGTNMTARPKPVCQMDENKQTIQFFGMIERILTKCASIKEAVDFLNSYNFAAVQYEMNLHWLIADENNDYCVLEYWRDDSGKDVLRVIDLDERTDASCLSIDQTPYGYKGIENFYCNRDAAKTYLNDSWQNWYSSKVRLKTMMDHYSPVMDEEEALRCLQYGNFELDVPGVPTDWSCVYNPKQRTVIFNIYDDLSRVWSIDLKKDLL